MAGGLTILPQRKTALDYAEPYLQQAFQMMMAKKLAEQQRQEAQQRIGQMMPDLFANQQTIGAAQQNLASEQPGVLSTMPESYKKILQGEAGAKPGQLNVSKLNTLPEGMKLNLEGAGYPVSFEKPKPDFMTQYLALQASGGLGGGVGSQDISAQIPEGENPEDFYLKPVITKVRGVPQKDFIAERKDKIPSKELGDLKDLDVNTADLEANLNMLEKNPAIKSFIGPGIAQRPGAIADIITQFGGAPKEFATFKAASDLAFQKYRKWVTGVQAGYPELQWIAVDYPKPTDKYEIYASKANKAMEGMQRNREIFLDYLSKNNYAVGKFKQSSQTQQGNDPEYQKYLQAIGG